MSDESFTSGSGSGASGECHLVVLELHHHSELLRNLYLVLSLGHFRITLVTLPDIFEKTGLSEFAGNDDLAVCLKEKEESVGDFLTRITPVFLAADILYFNTIRHYWSELNHIPIKCPAMVRIHNVHCDLAPCSHFNKPLVNAPAIFSHLIRKVVIGGEWRMRRRLFRRIGYFMFPNESITRYVRENNWASEHRILAPVLPFGYLGEKNYEKTITTDEITIAITGKVTNSKKDYDLVRKAFDLCRHRLRFPVRLMLLGKAGHEEGLAIVERFSSLASDSFALDFREGYVANEEFDQMVAQADFLLAPIQVDTHFRKYREVYGKSKMSGIENDILLYKKPSLVVSRYPMVGPMSRVVDYFQPTPESLAEALVEWINGRRFEQLKNNFTHFEDYRRQNIADNFYRLCQSLQEKTSLAQNVQNGGNENNG